MTRQTTSQPLAVEKTSMIVFQIGGKEIVSIPATVLTRVKGVYGWYVLGEDVEVLGPEYRITGNDHGVSTPERIYLYVGTVKDEPRRSVAARFVGELLGPQVCTDGKNKKFDTDFAVSCVIEFLCANGLNVYFDVLSNVQGEAEEMRIAHNERPLLQKITPKTVRLLPDFKRTISGSCLNDEVAAIGPAVLQRLKERV